MSVLPDKDHEFFMREALKEAQYAFDDGEIPVGAVVVCGEKIIGRGHNQTEKLHDVTAHAEMIAITAASNFIGGKYLKDCKLYVTLEPCVMCAGAMKWAQLSELIFGASDPKGGFSMLTENILHPKTKVIKEVLSKESEQLLKSFFLKLRE
ncbi:MAG: nucleoside deaminase [Cytophagales bacterium]